MKKRILRILICLCMAVFLMPQIVLAATTVTKVTVDQLELPKLGATPDTTAVAVVRSNRQPSSNVYVDKIEWDGELDANGCFKAGVEYKVTVTVKTKNGAVFGNSFKKGYRTEATLIVGSLSPTATSIDTDKCYWCYTKSASSNELVYYFRFSPLESSGISEFEAVNNVLNTIYDARDSFSPSRSVTEADVLAWGESLIPKEYNVKLYLLNYNKTEYVKPDETMSLSFAFVAESGSTKLNGKSIVKRILPEEDAVGSDDVVNLTADYEAIRTAFGRANISNATNAADMLKLAQSVCTNGTNVEITYFGMDKADYTKKGRITVKAKLTLDGESKNLQQDVDIPTMARTLPTGISITSKEWSAIRYTNIQRIKYGGYPVFAVDFMQDVANLRASDLTLSYSHTRPDGRGAFTAFSDLGYSYSSVSENIGKSTGAEKMVQDWMYSTTGHREALLNSKWSYIGLGYEYNIDEQCDYWAQLFTTGGDVVNWRTGLNKTTYADPYELEQDYLILTMSDGNTAYMPFDLGSMQRTTTGYKITLDKNTTAEFTVLRMDGEATKDETPKAEAKTDFIDVPAGSYYEDAVAWAVARNITSGTGKNTFSPDMTCTRGHVVTFLWRSKGEPEPTTKNNPFRDVSEKDWFYDAVLWAVENGITSGTSATTFSPNDTCTTAQILTFIYRFLENPLVNHSNSLYKTYEGKYYAEPLAWADSLKMIDGLAPGFNPNTDCTRASTVYYIYKGADSVGSGESDVGSYIDWSGSIWTSDPSQW